jgi:hypothetical protein
MIYLAHLPLNTPHPVNHLANFFQLTGMISKPFCALVQFFFHDLNVQQQSYCLNACKWLLSETDRYNRQLWLGLLLPVDISLS